MVGFMGGAAPDSALSSDLKGCSGLDAAALAKALSIAAAYLCSADAAHLGSAMEELSSAHSLKAKACKGTVRSLVLALGGAVKYGLSSEALGADLRAVGAWPGPRGAPFDPLCAVSPSLRSLPALTTAPPSPRAPSPPPPSPALLSHVNNNLPRHQAWTLSAQRRCRGSLQRSGRRCRSWPWTAPWRQACLWTQSGALA